MKKIILTSALIIFSQFLFAQDVKSDSTFVSKSDTTTRTYGKNKPIEVIKVDDKIVQINIENKEISSDEKVKTKTENFAHWSSFMMGMNILTNETQGINFENADYWEIDPAKSFSFSFNFAEKKVNLFKNYVGLTTGLGITFNNYSFRNNYMLSSNADTVFAIIDPTIQYSKNKLKSTYFRVPLLLEICTSSFDKGAYFSAGVVGGVRLGSKVKREGKDISNNSFKQKIKSDYNLNTFTLDALIKFGFDDFGIFAQYSLTLMFQNNKTQTIYPLNFGVTLEF